MSPEAGWPLRSDLQDKGITIQVIDDTNAALGWFSADFGHRRCRASLWLSRGTRFEIRINIARFDSQGNSVDTREAPRAAAAVLNGAIIDAIGAEIVAGELRPGDRLTLEGLQEQFGVSRTVVRDCMRILESMNLVYSKRRIGIVVQDPSHWNVFDSRIIRWRLSGPGRDGQFRTLTELRVAVEPMAAAGAARHAGNTQRSTLVELAARMRVLGEAGELEEFLAADIAFHTLLLRASGNEMFASLDEVVAEVLTGRTHQGRMPDHPREVALRGHELVAGAVAGGDADEAMRQMAALLEEVRTAVA